MARLNVRQGFAMLVAGLSRHFVITAIVLYSLVFCILFWRAVILGEVLLGDDLLLSMPPWNTHQPAGWRGPGNPLLSDPVVMLYPYAQYVRERLADFQIPLWNPYQMAGTPFLGNPTTAVFYPVNLLTLPLRLDISLTVSAYLRLLVAGLFTCLFCRQLALPRLASLLAGLAYMLSAYNVVWLGWPVANTSVFLPPTLFFILLCRSRGGSLSIALLAISTASLILGGHPETVFHLAAVVVLFGIASSLRGLPDVGRLRALGARLAKLAAAGLLGAGLAAVVYGPFLEYVLSSPLFSARASYDRNPFTLPFSTFVTFFVPDFFGTIVSPRWNYWGPGNMNEVSGYVGVLTIVLAFVGASRSIRDARAAFFATLTVISLLIVFGVWPIFELVTALPGYRQAANHRLLLVAEFSMAILAGIGLAQVRQWHPGQLARKGIVALIAAGGTIVLSGIAIRVAWNAAYGEQAGAFRTVASVYGLGSVMGTTLFAVLLYGSMLGVAIVVLWAPLIHRRGQYVVVFAPLLLALDLLVIWYGYNPTVARPTPYENTPGPVRFLQQQTGDFRIVAEKFLTLTPLTWAMYGLTDVRGYEAPSVDRYSEFFRQLLGEYDGSHFWIDQVKPEKMKFLSLLGVRFVLSTETVIVPDLKLVYTGGLNVYENPSPQQLAFFVSRAVELPRSAAIDAMRDPAFDPATTVIVEQPAASGLLDRLASALPFWRQENKLSSDEASARELEGLAPTRGKSGETLRVVVREPERIVLEVESPVAGWVVLSNAYIPGWRATVNGAAAPVHPADFALQAVQVPAGSSSIVVRYEPASFVVGSWVTVASAVAVLVLLIVALGNTVRRRQAAPDPKMTPGRAAERPEVLV